MVLVTVWDVMESIGSEIKFSAAERVSTLRLGEEVPQIRAPGIRGPFKGQSMGELRDEAITGLGRSFGRAHQIASAAALLENVLHHAAVQPKLFDMRQTGLPRLSMSAVDELRPVLFGAAQFEKRLVESLGAGKFRNFPRHGGTRWIGLSPDDWTSNPGDGNTVRKLAFLPEEIQPLLREAGVPFGAMHDAFTGEEIGEVGMAAQAGGTSSPGSAIDTTRDLPTMDGPDLELLPIERVEKASSDDVAEEPFLIKPGGNRTPKRFSDEGLAFLEQRNKNGEPWKKIAKELNMSLKALERHMTEYRKKKIAKEKEAKQASANPFSQLAGIGKSD